MLPQKTESAVGTALHPPVSMPRPASGRHARVTHAAPVGAHRLQEALQQYSPAPQVVLPQGMLPSGAASRAVVPPVPTLPPLPVTPPLPLLPPLPAPPSRPLDPPRPEPPTPAPPLPSLPPVPAPPPLPSAPPPPVRPPLPRAPPLLAEPPRPVTPPVLFAPPAPPCDERPPVATLLHAGSNQPAQTITKEPTKAKPTDVFISRLPRAGPSSMFTCRDSMPRFSAARSTRIRKVPDSSRLRMHEELERVPATEANGCEMPDVPRR